MSSIEDLVRDLKPVVPAPSPLRLSLYWTVFCLTLIAVALVLRQPGRPFTVWIELAQFAFTLLCGFTALASSSPHEIRASRRLLPVAALWPLPVIVSIFFIPTLIRAPVYFVCVAASVAWSLPAFFFLTWLLRKGFLLRPAHSFSLVALAAACLGALAQHIVCVEPGGEHRLFSHVVPAALFGAATLVTNYARRPPGD